MRSRQRWLAATAALLASLAAADARATLMVRASVEDLTRASDRVVVGEVVGTEATDRGPRPGIFTRVDLAIEDTWRGARSERVSFWVHGGRLGDRAMQTHGQATFAPGERVVVFLYDAGGGALFPTAMSQGKWRVADGLARSSADLGSLVERDASGHLAPTRRAADTLPLDALEGRVRSVR